jgi:hypothetical protein
MIIVLLTRGMLEKPKQIVSYIPSHDDFLHHNCVSNLTFSLCLLPFCAS